MKAANCLGFVFLIALVIVWVALASASRRYAPEAAAIKFGSNFSYDKSTVETLVSRHGADAAAFIFPVLFPLDLMLLFCIGATLALFSIGLGAAPGDAAGIGLLLILPAAYMLADLSENVVLAIMLSSRPGSVTNGPVTLVQSLTALKLLFGFAATLQVLVLAWQAYQRSH
jgi:hypothetical protein